MRLRIWAARAGTGICAPCLAWMIACGSDSARSAGANAAGADTGTPIDGGAEIDSGPGGVGGATAGRGGAGGTDAASGGGGSKAVGGAGNGGGGGAAGASEAGADLPLPFTDAGPFRIGHGFSDYQNYFGSAYLHLGVDLRAPTGASVRLMRSGRILEIVDPADAAIFVQDVDDVGNPTGRTWQYQHLNRDSIPSALRAAAGTSTVVAAGTVIGVLEVSNQEDATDGEAFDHLHLALELEDASGPYASEDFRRLLPIPDELPPTINRVLFVGDRLDISMEEVLSPEPVTQQLLDSANLSGDVDIVVDGYDTSNDSEGRPSPFKLGLNHVEVRVVPTEATEPVFAVQTPPFDRVELSKRFVTLRTMYVEFLESNGELLPASVGDWTSRTYAVVATNIVQNGWSLAGSWRTRDYPNGVYTVEAVVFDELGNHSSLKTEVVVNNP